MPMKTDFINGRELKVGSIFIPAGEKSSFYKVVDMTTSKPGKHGSAKSIVSSKNVVNGKNLLNTFLDSNEKIIQVLDFGYQHRVVYDKNDSEIVTNIELGESIYTQSFPRDDLARIEAEFDKFLKNGPGLNDSDGSPLVIKYSELGDAENTLIFWELFYTKPSELPKVGINDYVAN